MRNLRSVLISAALLGAIGPVNAEQPPPGNQDSAQVQMQVEGDGEKLSVPEPNTMLFAGLGGIILLMFAIRRK